ncbi:MAG: hypothetical protein ABIJ57_01010 [Pseudomonadota bacterium]
MKSLRTGWTRADKRAGYKSYSENLRDGTSSALFTKGSGNRTGGGGDSDTIYEGYEKNDCDRLSNLLDSLSQEQLRIAIKEADKRLVFGASLVLRSVLEEIKEMR